MKVTFVGTSRGRKLYAVSSDGAKFFTGTLDEVKRFLLIHNNKVHEREEQQRVQIELLRAP